MFTYFLDYFFVVLKFNHITFIFLHTNECHKHSANKKKRNTKIDKEKRIYAERTKCVPKPMIHDNNAINYKNKKNTQKDNPENFLNWKNIHKRVELFVVLHCRMCYKYLRSGSIKSVTDTATTTMIIVLFFGFIISIIYFKIHE